jgi:hypothetical protein
MALACTELYSSAGNVDVSVLEELSVCVVTALADSQDTVRQTALSAIRPLLESEVGFWERVSLGSAREYVQGMIDEGEGGEDATEVLTRIRELLERV